MKTKKMFLLFAAFIFAAVAGYNIHLAQSNQNSDMPLADITIMAQADGESGGGGYPVGQYCGRDTCSFSCGVPPYSYTADGHYWHCKWKDTVGDCDSNLCDKSCDAGCW